MAPDIQIDANDIQNDANIDNAHKGFRKIVDRCAKKELDRMIPNSAICHAAYLVYKLLESAAKHKSPIVRIISGKLDKNVYNQDKLVDVLEKCKESGVEMQVIVLDGVDDPNGNGGNKFYTSLKDYDKATCYEPNKANPKDIAGKTPHMLMVGEQGFRYETNTKTHNALYRFPTFGTPPSSFPHSPVVIPRHSQSLSGNPVLLLVNEILYRDRSERE